MRFAFVALAILLTTPTFAEDAKAPLSECDVALGEDGVLVAGMKQREETLAVQLARANAEIKALKADAEKAKGAPDGAPKP